ncbi:MAG TPA: beta-ketoacyl-ACP synthase II [Fibrobacteraceae bacterium]|nr:beta-ketoacyl-ACP synthase II [Fibrobacteraceae bacterium]
MEEVVVTGMGCVTPLGNNPNELWTTLLAEKSGISNIIRFNTEAYDVHFAGEIKNFDPSPYFNVRDAKRYSRNIQYVVHSAMTALENAGLDPKSVDPTRAGVILASGMGGMDVYYETSVTLSTRGPGRVSPFFIPMVISNMGSGEVSIRLGWMGPSFTPVSACASSNHSIISAVDQIRLGRADVMIAGGTEEAVCPIGIAGFAAMRAISTRNDDPERASRPFDKDRDGFVLGEGAGVLILESLSHAKKRGAKILARIAGVGMSADAHHISAPREDGLGVKLAIEMALNDARITSKDVGYVNTHGTSTPLGDVAECGAIYKAFDGHVDHLKVNSTKSMTGHMLGAASAVEGIVTVQSILDQKVHATKNVFEKDSRILLDVCDKGASNHNIKYAMSNSFGFGGHNSVVVFAKD